MNRKKHFYPREFSHHAYFHFVWGQAKVSCVFSASLLPVWRNTRAAWHSPVDVWDASVLLFQVCVCWSLFCVLQTDPTFFRPFFLTFQPIAPIGCLERLWVVIGPIPSWRKHVEFYFLFIYSGAIFFICSAVLTWACVVVGSLNSGRYLFILCLIWREIFTSLPDMFTKGVTIWSKRWKWLPAATPLPPSPNQHPQQERVCQQL